MTQRTDNTPPTPPDKNRLWEIYLQKNPHWASEGVHLTPEGLRKFVEQVWQHYLTKNPHWQENGAKLTAAGLKKLFEQTWEQGYRVGHKQAFGQSLRDQLGDVSDLFNHH